MGCSADFRALKRRLSVLRARFLPRKFSQMGAYSAKQLDRARAYCLLAHAEIEHYLEKRAREIVVSAMRKWRESRYVSHTLVHLACNINGNRVGLPTKLGCPESVTSILQEAVNQYFHSLDTNHGIRIENILRILLPIGVRESDLDPVWLSTIDAFGGRRGRAAHSSAVTYTIDPQDELNTVKSIMDGLRELDQLLNRMLRQLG